MKNVIDLKKSDLLPDDDLAGVSGGTVVREENARTIDERRGKQVICHEENMVYEPAGKNIRPHE